MFSQGEKTNMAMRTHNLHTGRLIMNGTNGLYVHVRGEKIGDWKMGKCIVAVNLKYSICLRMKFDF